MTTRLNIVPVPGFMELKPVLAERFEKIGSSLGPEQFAGLLDPLMRQVLEAGFAEAGAQEGTIWLLDASGEFLVPAHNTGPRAAELVGKFKQPLNAGLICMVFASEQPFLENEVWRNQKQSKLVDTLLHQQTSAMIAVPFYLAGACRGVVSCVQLKNSSSGGSEPTGFQPSHLAIVQRATALLSQLIEFQLLSRLVGWSAG